MSHASGGTFPNSLIAILFIMGWLSGCSPNAPANNKVEQQPIPVAPLPQIFAIIPSEWNDAVTYLSDIPIPKETQDALIQNGYVFVLIVKSAGHATDVAYGVITQNVITQKGEYYVLCPVYAVHDAIMDAWFDVGDLIAIKPIGNPPEPCWLLYNNNFIVIKKFAFVPDNPANRK